MTKIKSPEECAQSRAWAKTTRLNLSTHDLVNDIVALLGQIGRIEHGQDQVLITRLRKRYNQPPGEYYGQ